MSDDGTRPARVTPPPRVLACGLATLDVVQTVDRVPRPDEKVVARDLLVAAGGPATNAAVTCALLGLDARLLTRVGDSPVGRVVAGDLARRGVEVVDVAAPGASPAVSTVLVTAATGERAVASVNATRAADDGTDARAVDQDDRVPDDVLDGVAAVLVDGHHLDLAIPVARAARSRGIPVLLDGGSWKPGLEDLLAHVDVAVLSADLRVPPDHAGDDDGTDDGDLAAVARLGPGVVARSHGGDPVDVLVDGRRLTVPVAPVAVVDTLGAGDVLHGALLAWWAQHHAGPDAADASATDTAAGLRFATGVASRSCGAGGAHGWADDEHALAAARAELTGGQAASGS
ncbi:PfkB family carbohydrate kinase [Cellulomonas carbonis]|uniref:Sugar kinase n=1 Tax=Cellulomonas carbonis T26 TaxID=947969 RepID=A0A0A0BPE5_9CELL|nr:PfkB family carbohydrate kinase [Cellulomonas carbonis]KGM10353.1 sugar kinase [Cellulomonas carbonis T26]GGC04450.1 kinase [Cellulomonas carbonis]